VDGNIHDIQKDYDAGRTNELKNYNIKIVRFNNDDIINDINGVIVKIKNTIENIKQNGDLPCNF
jgi:very-short-patch-repair endonuclease